MYKCEMRFCLFGSDEYFPVIKSSPPLEGFVHKFTDDIGKADAVIADVRELPDDKAALGVLEKLLAERPLSAQIVIITDNDEVLDEKLSEDIFDVWTAPMNEKTLRIRLRTLQKFLKSKKDEWQAEQFLDTLIDTMPSMVWFKSKDGVHEKVNREFCKTVGKTRDDVIGKKHAYIWGVPQDDPGCISSDNRAMETGITVMTDESVPSQNGTRDLIAYKSALYDADGSVMGTAGYAMDVTKERLFKQDILEKNKMFENMFASIDCGMMCHSLNGKEIYYINKTALKILGYESCDELMEHGFNYIAESVADEDKERLSMQITSLKNPGDSVNVEYNVRHADGSVLCVLGNIKLVYDDGRYFYQRYLLDVTDRDKDGREFQRRQSELVQALAAKYTVVCYFDLNTGLGEALHIVECPKGVLGSMFEKNGSRNSKTSLEKCLKMYCSSCVDADDRAALLEACSCENLKKELADKDTFVMNYRVSCDAEEKYFQIKVVKVGSNSVSESNRFGVVFGIRNVDVELRKEMENKALLESALEEANRANNAKSVFLSNMSHDIRTPMNAIAGFTDLALAHISDTERVSEYLNKIKISGRYLLGLINDVLDMSRIESGKMQLDEKPCSLTEIMRGLENMLRPEARKKKINITVSTDVQNDDVICDKLHIDQVMINLLSNAVKYTPSGGDVSFKVTEKRSRGEEFSFYEFEVADNGAGMSEDFLEHIFEPFERERNTTASGIQGTGLGMAITKNIVDLMHGAIDVKSAKNVGTTVAVTFEFKHCGSKPPQPQIAEPPANVERTGRILLVEDNELNREIAATLLIDAGFEVECAENGKIAVEMLENADSDHFGVVLMDIQMPVMNGYEATKRIRALPNKELRKIPVFAMTANAFEEDKREAAKNGMNGHLSKPIEIDKLLRALDSVFGFVKQ